MTDALDALLHHAVVGVGGQERPGQVEMARAVSAAISSGEHLLVQAGTGTGKSLAYLVPAVLHAQETRHPVVVATATLALQSQIVDRDMPRLADALAAHLPRRPSYALVKGRRNYVCVHKLQGGFPDDEDTLFGLGSVDANASRIGAEVVRVRRWAESTASGDRDELVPGVSERAWRQVSVAAQECLGGKCPLIGECFVEKSRAAAHEVDVVVTNHSFMAIDALEGRQMLPEHDVLIIDEAHELVDRVTSTITDEITGSMVVTAARKAGRMAASHGRLEEVGSLLDAALADLREGRFTGIPDLLQQAMVTLRAEAATVATELKPANPADNDAARQVARAAVDEIHDTADRLLEARELDVVWLADDPRRGKVIRVAPMSVAGLIRDRVLTERTVVLTSATIELGGTFDAVAGTLGLRGDEAPPWRGLDVGSPFDYRKQGIAYVAKHLPAPGRMGTAPEALDEIEALVRAAGGRTLGLFSSMRAAQAAASELRMRFVESDTDIEILCQGEDQITTLVRQFARSASTCLFGTLTLWQGVDVPGSACQLVIIDRIPFPRPDDPLASARTEAIAKMGGNGFMAVSATHAALRLAQGSGRLIRRMDDRGVVAFLDSRMMTARYAGFLQRSLPPFWPTTDRDLVLRALARLDESAQEVLPVDEPALRGLAAALSGATDDDASDGDAPLLSGPPAPAPPTPPSSRSAVTSGRAWSRSQDAALRGAVDAGLDVAEIAAQLDRPEAAVTSRLSQLGLRVGEPSLGIG